MTRILCYHDVVAVSDRDTAGFPGPTKPIVIACWSSREPICGLMFSPIVPGRLWMEF